jgi:SAM-dependent methyltransferase
MHPQLFTQGGILLHVAPEHGLSRKLANNARSAGMCYRHGDLSGCGETYLDLLDLPIATDSITLVYCCHVLNAMADDVRAMREVYRVLHPEGLAILQVPAFYEGATTLETNSADDRMAIFGDGGIYRCYTNDDYETRLRSVGFEVQAFRASDVADELVHYHQLKREVVHLCRKPPGADA